MQSVCPIHPTALTPTRRANLSLSCMEACLPRWAWEVGGGRGGGARACASRLSHPTQSIHTRLLRRWCHRRCTLSCQGLLGQEGMGRWCCRRLGGKGRGEAGASCSPALTPDSCITGVGRGASHPAYGHACLRGTGGGGVPKGRGGGGAWGEAWLMQAAGPTQSTAPTPACCINGFGGGAACPACRPACPGGHGGGHPPSQTPQSRTGSTAGAG